MARMRALTAGCSVILLMAMPACAGESDDDQVALNGGGIGDARIATSGSAEQAGVEPDGTAGDAVEGQPSLDDLDDSGPAPGAVGAPGRSCSGGDLVPTGTNSAQIVRATVCLINVERRTRGLPPLRANRQLARAGLDHARDMVNRAYFSHETLGGGGFIGRIKARGYMAGRGSWTVGENLAWGGGSSGTPRVIMTTWMASPTHRANILNRRFRDIGLGLVIGAPVQGGRAAQAATYGNEFGVRGPR
jgi:uncharacterized protein YkwD